MSATSPARWSAPVRPLTSSGSSLPPGFSTQHSTDHCVASWKHTRPRAGCRNATTGFPMAASRSLASRSLAGILAVVLAGGTLVGSRCPPGARASRTTCAPSAVASTWQDPQRPAWWRRHRAHHGTLGGQQQAAPAGQQGGLPGALGGLGVLAPLVRGRPSDPWPRREQQPGRANARRGNPRDRRQQQAQPDQGGAAGAAAALGVIAPVIGAAVGGGGIPGIPVAREASCPPACPAVVASAVAAEAATPSPPPRSPRSP